VVAIDRDVDIGDQAAVHRAVSDSAPDAIYHLAALTHVGRSWDDPGANFAVNAGGTLHVLEAARACPSPPRVLLVSSSEVYGAVADAQLPLTEAAPLAPVSPYAASKVAAEYLGIQAYLGYGLGVVRVRPFNHIGPGQANSFVVAALASRIVQAQQSGRSEIVVGNLQARRDFTDVRDVVRAYRMLVVEGAAGEVYNICSGTAISIAELARRLIETAGADLRLVVDPDLVQPVDIPVLYGDPSRLAEATGWRVEHPLADTLRDVLEYWRGHQTAL